MALRQTAETKVKALKKKLRKVDDEAVLRRSNSQEDKQEAKGGEEKKEMADEPLGESILEEVPDEVQRARTTSDSSEVLEQKVKPVTAPKKKKVTLDSMLSDDGQSRRGVQRTGSNQSMQSMQSAAARLQHTKDARLGAPAASVQSLNSLPAEEPKATHRAKQPSLGSMFRPADFDPMGPSVQHPQDPQEVPPQTIAMQPQMQLATPLYMMDQGTMFPVVGMTTQNGRDLLGFQSVVSVAPSESNAPGEGASQVQPTDSFPEIQQQMLFLPQQPLSAIDQGQLLTFEMPQNTSWNQQASFAVQQQVASGYIPPTLNQVSTVEGPQGDFLVSQPVYVAAAPDASFMEGDRTSTPTKNRAEGRSLNGYHDTSLDSFDPLARRPPE